LDQLELNTPTPETRVTYFVDVILPVPIPKLFTYRLPYELNKRVEIGQRVVVQFGPRKILTGIIGKIHQIPPTKYEARYILELLDDRPSVNFQQLKLFQWIADYYMSTLGEVINVAIPSGLKLSSESKIQLHPDFSLDFSDYEYSEKEKIVINNLLTRETLTYPEVKELTDLQNINNILKSLIKKEVIIIFEEVKEKYKPKKQKRIRLHSNNIKEKALEAILKKIEKFPKQVDILLKYLKDIPILEDPKSNLKGMEKLNILHGEFSSSSLSTLIKNNVFEEFEVIVPRFEESGQVMGKVSLTDEQQAVKDEIVNLFEKNETVLLHGITGSGKTEVYIELIQSVLDNDAQVLYLLPEIALTTQIVSRLKKIFGDEMGVYHSRFSDNERVEIWNGVLDGRFSFVVGVRSAVFLPFDNLGLVIVDEEHEGSFKQFDPSPRYHARDVSMIMAQIHHAKVLLGSATPSIESYYHAISGKYGLAKLPHRFGVAQLPEIITVDVIKERKKKTMQAEFTSVLLNELTKTIENGEQAIIFQNRRGYSPYITCDDCAWIPKCENCAVSLTYHLYKEELRCHYCGYKQRLPINCEACGSTNIRTISYGTEKLEEDLKLIFHHTIIQRMDLDTTRRKHSYEQIINDFETGKTDILIGTQMVSKGLDFDNVSLVGIFDIDRMLHFPDFRSVERTFQLTTQVSGRAGRREKTGKVVIQTTNPAQKIIDKIIKHDYQSFYEDEIKERQKYRYPPFVRLIKLIIKNSEKDLSQRSANKLAISLKKQLGEHRILGPQEPVINKIRNMFLMDIFIKLERDKINLKEVKKITKEQISLLLLEKEFKKSRVVIDVDPM